MKIREKLQNIQQNLKSPKDQKNEFGNYPYRTLGGTLEKLKPLLAEYKCLLKITDDLVEKNGRFYIKATASLMDLEMQDEIESTSYAREQEERRGMDASQITGSASTYARKYALSALFSIDDSEDADHMAPQYWPDEKRIERFAMYLEHSVFKGRKKKAKEKWKACTTDAQSDNVLQFMNKEIQEYNERMQDED